VVPGRAGTKLLTPGRTVAAAPLPWGPARRDSGFQYLNPCPAGAFAALKAQRESAAGMRPPGSGGCTWPRATGVHRVRCTLPASFQVSRLSKRRPSRGAPSGSLRRGLSRPWDRPPFQAPCGGLPKMDGACGDRLWQNAGPSPPEPPSSSRPVSRASPAQDRDRTIDGPSTGWPGPRPGPGTQASARRSRALVAPPARARAVSGSPRAHRSSAPPPPARSARRVPSLPFHPSPSTSAKALAASFRPAGHASSATPFRSPGRLLSLPPACPGLRRIRGDTARRAFSFQV
jgi:hypothetical protein